MDVVHVDASQDEAREGRRWRQRERVFDEGAIGRDVIVTPERDIQGATRSVARGRALLAARDRGEGGRPAGVEHLVARRVAATAWLAPERRDAAA